MLGKSWNSRMNPYDLVEYPSYAIPQCYPDKLAVVASMFGVDVAPPDRARVLDVGCGSGANLLPMAMLWPGSEYVGIDLAQSAIDKANANLAQLGLTNVHFMTADLMDLPPDFGKFDYIIAHGFISWVPTFVRKRLFEVCRDRLTPRGIAFISYNAYPGSHIRDMFRQIMLEHTRGIADPMERAEEARSMVQLIAESGISSDVIQELVRSERDIICRKSIGAFYHDELEINFNPIYFHEFASLASGHDLQFIFEAVYSEGSQPMQLTEEANELLEKAAARGVLVHEQYQDFLKLRRFRQSLVTHSSIPIDRTAPPRMMHKFHFAAPLQRTMVPEGVEFSNPQTKAAVITPNPITISALDRVGKAWPSTVPYDQLTDNPKDGEGLEAAIERFFAAGLVDAHATPRVCLHEPGSHPEIWKYARWQAQNNERVLTPLTLTGVAVEDEHIRKLVLLADGTRSVDDLAAAIGDRAGVERSLIGAARMGFVVPTGSGLP